MAGKAFSREVRKVHILQGFVNRYKNGKTGEVTAPMVARALMLEPSAHIRGLLGELVRDGDIEMRLVDNPHGFNLINATGKTGWYKLAEKHAKSIEREAREISVKKSGKIVGQLRLF